MAERRWLPLLLGQAALVQAVVFVARPTTSYRALELGVPAAWLGAVAASFTLLPLLVAVPVGRFVDRRGPRPALLGGALVLVVATAALVALGRSVAGLVVGSALLGVGHLLSIVAQQSAVAAASADERQEAAFGHYGFAASLGQLLGPALVAVVGGGAAVPDTGLLLVAALGLAVLLAVVTVPLHPPVRRTGAGAARGGVAVALRVPGLPRAIVTSLTVVAAIDLIVVYLPALGTERGIAAGTVGVLLAVRAGASMVSRLFLGALVARLGRHRLLVGSVAVSAAAVAVVPMPLPVWLLAAALAVAGLALGIGQPMTMALVARASPEHVRATALSLRLSGNRLGQTVLPTALGFFAAGAGVGGVLWATAGALAAVAVAAGRLR